MTTIDTRVRRNQRLESRWRTASQRAAWTYAPRDLQAEAAAYDRYEAACDADMVCVTSGCYALADTGWCPACADHIGRYL